MPHDALTRHLRDLGRGMIGALVFATPFLYTMETWWLAWRLPGEYLVVYTLVGLALVILLVRSAGIRVTKRGKRESKREVVVDMLELTLQSFLAAYVVLLMFGILEFGDPWIVVARLGLIHVVPLALGASIASRALVTKGGGAMEAPFPNDIAIFAVGALFVSLAISPTEEMERMAAHASWRRLFFVILVSLALAYLVLFELEFKGQPGRRVGLTPVLQVGEVFLVYAVALGVSFALLVAFGHTRGTPVTTWVQETVTLSFLATLGGSAARVIF